MEFKGLNAKLYDFSLKIGSLGREKKIREEVANLIPKNKKLKILDIACGTGSQLVEIKKQTKKAECYGIDISKDMLDIAKKKSGKENVEINFFKQDMKNLNFEKDCFDFVIASLALHEVPFETRKKAIKEVRRVLKKNRRFIIVDFRKAEGLLRVFQKISFLFEKHLKNSLETKEKLLSKFNKRYSKNFLGLIRIEVYSH